MHQNCEVISYNGKPALQTNLLLIDEPGAHDLVNEIGKSFPMADDWNTHCRSVSQGQVLLFEIISATQAAQIPTHLSEVPALIRDFEKLLALSEEAGRKEETRLWCTLTEKLRSTEEGMFYDIEAFLDDYEPLASCIEIFLGMPAGSPEKVSKIMLKPPPKEPSTSPLAINALEDHVLQLASALEKFIFATHSCKLSPDAEKAREESLILLQETRKKIPLP